MTDILRLKKSNCKNCYKCIRYCPVKSIRISGNQAHIVGSECILCGRCVVVCPQNAKEIVDETEKVQVMIQSGVKVVASLAPSFIASYQGTGIAAMAQALQHLGFYDAEETALGATLVKREYEKLLQDGTRSVLISSCCHSINLLVQKYFPRALPSLADVISPMQAHALDIKRRHPDAKVVFIGPCVAKKEEAAYYGDIVDAVLTFEELSYWMHKCNITPAQETDSNPCSRARFFPTTGGILKTMAQDAPGYTYMAVDGIDSCMAVLKEVETGNVQKCFIEMSACQGSCIGGPARGKEHHSPVLDYISVTGYSGEKDFCVKDLPRGQMIKEMAYISEKPAPPTEAEIEKILRQMGKTMPKDQLNCGSCGYNTCKEKAMAIFQGKAHPSMCLPFLKEKAESFSDNIISNTPNCILVLNENLEVQQINRSALEMLNLRDRSSVLGAPVVRILDPSIFLKVRDSGRAVRNYKTYLAEYGKYVEQTVLYDKDYHILIVIMRDITEEVNVQEKKESLARQTVEITDKVIGKQMRIVQEIASLLGETTAETKIALTKLKGTILDE